MDSGFGMRMMVPRGGGLVAEFVLDFIFWMVLSAKDNDNLHRMKGSEVGQ